MAKAWKAYLNFMDTRPLLGKSLTAASLMGLGDFLAQTVLEPMNSKPEDSKNKSYDLVRTARMSLIGFTVNGPLMHNWYGFLYSRFPSKTTSGILTKVALDQTLFAPVILTGILGSNQLLQGVPLSTVYENLKKIFIPTLITNWSVWPLAMIINFKFVPPSATVLYVSSIAVCWNSYLSLIGNRH